MIVASGANIKRYNTVMLAQYLALNLDDQIHKMFTHGFCVMDNFLPEASISALSLETDVLNEASLMHKAGIGQQKISINTQLRGDYIYWLDEVGASLAQQAYFRQMELLRIALNQQLYLGLFELESHLALYPVGTFYKKHLDRFQTNGTSSATNAVRQVSCILYLNPHWAEEDGGQLRVYSNQVNKGTQATYFDISPIGGRFVMFLSDTFYHEVLPASRTRKSLTAWFLTR